MIIFKMLLIILVAAPVLVFGTYLFFSAKQMADKKDYNDEQKELSKKYGYRSQEFYEKQTIELPQNYFYRDRSNRR